MIFQGRFLSLDIPFVKIYHLYRSVPATHQRLGTSGINTPIEKESNEIYLMNSQIFFQLLSLFLVVTAGPLVIFLVNSSKVR